MSARKAFFQSPGNGNIAGDLTAPPEHFAAITPSDELELEFVTRAIRCNSGGTITYLGAGDTVPVTETYDDGGFIVGQIKKVFATGTTATGLVARW